MVGRDGSRNRGCDFLFGTTSTKQKEQTRNGMSPETLIPVLVAQPTFQTSTDSDTHYGPSVQMSKPLEKSLIGNFTAVLC